MTGDSIKNLMALPGQEEIFGSPNHNSLYIFHFFFDLDKKKKTHQETNFPIIFNLSSQKHFRSKTGSLNPFKGLRASNGSRWNISNSTVSRLSCEAGAVREAVPP